MDTTNILDVYTDFEAANEAVCQEYEEVCDDVLEEEPHFDSGHFIQDGTLHFHVLHTPKDSSTIVIRLERRPLR